MKRRITATQDGRMTIEDAFQEFLYEKKAINRATQTIIDYERAYKHWIHFVNEHIRSNSAADLNTSYVTSFASDCLSRKMNPITLNHYLRHIRAFVYFCIDKGYAAPFKIRLVAEQQPVKRTFTNNEKRALIAQPKENDSFVDWRMWAVANWVLATGSRAGTVVSVQIRDLNFADSEITIRQTKTKKAMILPMSPALKKVLKVYVRKWRANAQDTDFLFPNVTNERLAANALSCSFAKFCRGRGVQNTSIHAMRHTFAKDYIKNMCWGCG